jgi:hypothetical protein
MNYQIKFGSVVIKNKTVDLPGVPVQLENVENSLIVMVDNRSTPNNLFRISSTGEIEWQIQYCGSSPRFKKFLVIGGRIILSDVTGFKYLIDFQSGKFIESELEDSLRVIKEFLKKRSMASKT